VLRGDSFPLGLSGFRLTVHPEDPATAHVVGFDSPEYGLASTQISSGTVVVEPGGLRLDVVDLADLVEPGDFGPLLTTVRIEGLSAGQTDFVVTVLKADDEDGFPIDAVGVGAQIQVAASRDLDGDGLTEDCNGNGLFDFADVTCWFDHLLVTP
ncbi:hypothetical protein LCGC14_0695240, partial [marine sediment metagenome]